MAKIYEWLTWLLGGVILGLLTFEVMRKPETVINNKIGKQKVKNGNGNNEANNKYTLRDDDGTQYTELENDKYFVKKKKKRFLNFLRRKKK